MTLFRLVQLDKFHHRNMAFVLRKGQTSLLNLNMDNQGVLELRSPPGCNCIYDKYEPCS